MPYLHGLVFILATPIELVTNFIVDRGFVCNQGIKDLVADWLPWQGGNRRPRAVCGSAMARALNSRYSASAGFDSHLI
ncbi:MAG: hypothetical protein R3F31_02095 [Verrucomicrobiales bacterium]